MQRFARANSPCGGRDSSCGLGNVFIDLGRRGSRLPRSHSGTAATTANTERPAILWPTGDLVTSKHSANGGTLVETADDEGEHLLKLAANLAINPQIERRPEQAQIADELLASFQSLAALTGWGMGSVGEFIGCSDPDPESWLSAPLDVLTDSHDVLSFLDRMTNTVFESRGVAGAREILYLSLETLRRTRGDTAAASVALSSETPHPDARSATDLVADDDLCRARLVMRRHLDYLSGDHSFPSDIGRLERMGKADDQTARPFVILDAEQTGGPTPEDLALVEKYRNAPVRRKRASDLLNRV